MLLVIDSALSATLPAVVTPCRGTIPHQHACPSSTLKDIVYTLDTKGAAFFKVASPDVLRYTFSLCTSDIVVIIGVIRGRPQVRFASDQDDWDGRTTDRPHLFYPLFIRILDKPTAGIKEGSLLLR